MRRRRLPVMRSLIVASMLLVADGGLWAQSMTFSRVGVIDAAVDTVEIAAGHAYTASAKVLAGYDLTNPAMPKPTGRYTFPEEIWSFRMVGRTIYAGVNFFGLGVLDVSAPATPVLRSTFKTPGQAKVGAVVGTRAVVIDHMEGLVDVDLSNPAKAVGQGSFFLDGYARDVVAAGTLAYAVDSPSGLYVFDLSRPPPLAPIAAVQTGTALRLIEVTELPNGRRLAVLVGGGLLQIYDVSSPTEPAKLSTFRTPGGAQRIALQGALAYVADGKAGVQVIDLSRPSAPQVVGAFQTAAAARDVAVSGDLLLVATADEVLVLRTRATP